MKEIKQRLDRTFLKPRGKVSRYFSTAFIFLVGAASIYLYFAIVFFLCSGNSCADLVITRPWIRMPELFALYGICCLVTGVFIFRAKNIQVVYTWAIDILIGSGFLLFSKAFFAIAIEIANKA